MSMEINCKDQKVKDIMRDVKEKSESVIYGGWHVVIGKSNDPIMEFTNLDCLNEDEQHELLGNLDVMITHLQLEVNSNFGILPIIESKIPTMRKLNLVKSLYNQVVDEIQKNMNNEREENKAKKIEEEYSKMSEEELKNELKELEVVKDYCREWLQLYSGSRIHPTYKENIESILIEVNSKIDVINKILAYRELKESTHIITPRNEKWKRYNNLEVEELEMILDALNVKCTLRKCELHKCEDNYESRAIKKAMDDILDNIKVIKDVLKCKRGK